MKLSLKACRVNANLTHEQVADKLKINVCSLSNWENGKQMPRFDIVKKMAELYKVDINDIEIKPQ